MSETPATLVLLIRHGATPTTGQVLPGRAPGLHLSATGREQAERMAARFDGLPLDALVTSPMERARETAQPLEAAAGRAAVVVDDLIECDFGDWTGRRLTELNALPEWKEVQRSPSTFAFPGGEGFRAMQHRVVAAVHGLVERHPGGTIACVSHADPLKALLNHELGAPLDRMQRIEIGTCSVSAIAYHPDRDPSVLRMGTTSGPLADLR